MSTLRFRVEGPAFTASRKRGGNPVVSQDDPTNEGDGQPFVFVGGASCKDGNANTRRRMKQHVVRDYMQKKKRVVTGPLFKSPLDHPQPSSRSAPRPIEPGEFPKPLRSEAGSLVPLFSPPRSLGSPSLPRVKLVPRENRQQRLPALARDDDPELPDQVPHEFVKHLPGATSPMTFLGAARTDPFASYPFEVGTVEQQILDFHNYAMGEIAYGFGPKAPLCYFRKTVSSSLQDEAILHLVLAFATYRWATLCGGSPMHESTALAHKIKGIKIVNERIGDPKRGPDDFNIQAALIMSGIEGRMGNIEGFKSHIYGIRSMVALRGGLAALSPVLMWQVCSMELRIMEKVGIESMPYSDKTFTAFVVSRREELPTLPCLPASFHFFDPADLPPRLYLHACVFEFLQMIRNFHSLSSARNTYSINNPSLSSLRFPAAECVSVSSTFRPNAPLHSTLLPSRPLPNLNANAAAAQVYEQDTTRLGCLLYIHATLWSHRGAPFRTDAYVAHIASQTIQNNIDRSGSVEGLSWILIWVCLTERDEHINERMERTRLILRLMRVARKFGLESWRRLEKGLFEGLVGAGGHMEAGNREREREWERRRDGDNEWIEPTIVWREAISHQ